MKAPFFRTGYNYDRDEASIASGLLCLDESKAIQSQEEEANINTIVRRFGLTGQLPENVRRPVYGDFTGLSDYREALDAVKAADASFMAMPAEVRARFDHDAAAFVDFCSDPANLPELRKLGLAVPEVPLQGTGQPEGGQGAAAASGASSAS